MVDDPDAHTGRLATESLAHDDPTGWFESLYVQAAEGSATVPWDRDVAHPLLTDWLNTHSPDGTGRSALVVGSGLGRDAEQVSAHGFDTTAFDISPTALRTTQERFPHSAVRYVTADLLHPPADWIDGFDLVIESITVQSMPVSVRATAIDNVAAMVGSGGQLVVISGIRGEGEQVEGPPWPLSRSEVDSFATRGLQEVAVEQLPCSDTADISCWRAVFRRE